MKEFRSLDRRRFMASMGAATLSFTVVKPGLARGTGANSKIKLGMIGCGLGMLAAIGLRAKETPPA